MLHASRVLFALDCLLKRASRALHLPALLCTFVVLPAVAAEPIYRCTPTPVDDEGPFYRAGAPLGYTLGTGYRLSGRVLSATDCRPLAGAKIEVWLTGPDGRYAERWRTQFYAGRHGGYSFQSHFPGPYGSRPPHIHIVVNYPGFRELITQHYPTPGTGEATFDLVLVPE